MKFLDVFAGIGGFRFGLMESGHQPVGHIEKDKYAIKSYNAMYDTDSEFEARDVREVDPNDLPDFELLSGGFPCFPSGTNIVTDKGVRYIEDIDIGDKVLTHKKMYKEVIDTMSREYSDDLVKVKVPYNLDVKVTKEHPFYVRRSKDSKTEWIYACDLKEGYYVSTPLEESAASEYTYINNNIILRSFNDEQHESFIEDEYIWSKIKGVEYIEQEKGITVYNISVREDQSYTAEGFAVHNCQSFSIAGKRGGFEDTRGTLFFEIARLAKERQPKYLLLENVKGLLSHDKGKTFATILNTLHDLGYWYEWQVLNSKDFSKPSRPSPQNRERVFIVGHLGGGSGGKVFPITRKNKRTLKEHTSGVSQGYRVYDSEGVSCTLNAKGGGLGAKTGLYVDGDKLDETEVVGNTVPSGHSAGNVYNPLGLSPTVRENHGKGVKTIVAERGRYNEDGDIEQRLEKRDDDLSNTVTSVQKDNYLLEKIEPVMTPDFKSKGMNKKSRVGSRNGNMFTVDGSSIHGVTDGVRIRKLTPKETWRLQGFPDRLFNKAKEEGLSDTQLYKQSGNSVTTNVVEVIGERLKEIEEDNNA